MEYIFKKDDPGKFWSGWCEYTAQLKAGPRYLHSDAEYLGAVMKHMRTLAGDESFIAAENGTICAAVLLPIEETKGVRSVSVQGGFYTSLPLVEEKYEKEIFTLIDGLAKENKIDKILFAAEPLMKTPYNVLQKYDYLDTSILMYVIDTQGGDDLSTYRKGHRSDVKRLANDPNISVLVADADNPAPELHKTYERIRIALAGRLPRTKETYATQYQQLLDGNAALFALKQGNEIIACSYFFYAQDKARYGSSAHDPAYNSVPASHLLMHEARRYFAKRGITTINSELPSSPSTQFDYYPDEKWLSIAKFKRGFPGRFIQEFRGIKYFSPDVFKRDVYFFLQSYERIVAENNQ